MERNRCVLVMRYEKQEVHEEIKREVRGKTGKKKRKCGLERLRMMSEDREREERRSHEKEECKRIERKVGESVRQGER